MDAGHRENGPLRNIHRMVADALEVLGDHQKVDRTFPVRRVLGDLCDQLLLYAVKIFIHNIVFGIFLIDLCFSIHLGAVVQKKAAEIDKNVYDAIDVQKLWHKMQSRGGFFRLVSIRPLTERIDAFDEFLHRRPGSMGKEK